MTLEDIGEIASNTVAGDDDGDKGDILDVLRLFASWVDGKGVM